MEVTITKDCFDGTRSKAIDADLDGMSINQLIWMLMRRDVASITITKRFDLRGAIDKSEEGQCAAASTTT